VGIGFHMITLKRSDFHKNKCIFPGICLQCLWHYLKQTPPPPATPENLLDILLYYRSEEMETEMPA